VDSNYDMTGWAADPRLKVDAMLQTDTQGRPLLGEIGGANPARLAGVLQQGRQRPVLACR
jgi:hypothetical protein